MHRRFPYRPVRLLVLVGFAISLGACAAETARINQFNTFAQAGSKFADAVPPVLDAAFAAAVETDSLVLLQARAGLSSQDDRLKAIEESTKSLSHRIAILNDLKRQTHLLRAYFVALQALAQTNAESSGMSDVADGLVGALGKVSPRIANATIGGSPISHLVAPAVSFAFTTYQSAVLNRQLRKNAATIERELDLQRAALTAIAAAMKADIQTQSAAADRNNIVLPFVRGGKLPSNWTQRRVDAFQRQVQTASVDAAAQAAQSLRMSFVALVENRLDDTGITALLQDIDAIVTFVEGMQGTQQKERQR